MLRLKLTVLSATTALLAWTPFSPAVAAGPLLVPWAVGHLVGAAARLAAVPLIASSAMSAAGAAPPPAGLPPYYASPAYYGSPAYSLPGYYASAEYSPPQRFYASPAPYGAYYGWRQPYYAPPIYRGPAHSVGPMQRFSQPARGYSAPGMRYSGSYGRQIFGSSRAFAHWR
jgi:hypothetical protein